MAVAAAGGRLVQEYPSRALSWYAVGVYYLATHQHEQARRYFGKATALDASCAVAWIGFGHAFALQDESDQVSMTGPPILTAGTLRFCST